MLDLFLSPADYERARRTLEMLCRHSVGDIVLAGGLAIELHCIQQGLVPQLRTLNDIDFIVDAFESIPETLSADLLFRHVHPHDPVNKTLIQAVDPGTAVRVDIFRAAKCVIARAQPLDLFDRAFRLISIQDLKARAARLSLDLAEGRAMPAKHARDFLRLLALPSTDALETAWQDNRKVSHPATFAEAAALLEQIIPATRGLQIVPVYSQDVRPVCSRCEPTQAFALTESARFLSLLGYC